MCILCKDEKRGTTVHNSSLRIIRPNIPLTSVLDSKSIHCIYGQSTYHHILVPLERDNRANDKLGAPSIELTMKSIFIFNSILYKQPTGTIHGTAVHHISLVTLSHHQHTAVYPSSTKDKAVHTNDKGNIVTNKKSSPQMSNTKLLGNTIYNDSYMVQLDKPPHM